MRMKDGVFFATTTVAAIGALQYGRRKANFTTGGIMSPDAFIRWLAEMKAAGLARSDAECARLLGVSANAVVAMKKNGTSDRRTDLSCRALLHRMEPYA